MTGLSAAVPRERAWNALSGGCHPDRRPSGLLPRRGRSPVDLALQTVLEAAELRSAGATNTGARDSPFAWTKTADEFRDKVAAYCQRISDSGQ